MAHRVYAGQIYFVEQIIGESGTKYHEYEVHAATEEAARELITGELKCTLDEHGVYRSEWFHQSAPKTISEPVQRVIDWNKRYRYLKVRMSDMRVLDGALYRAPRKAEAATNLKRARISANLTQDQLAGAAQISTRTLQEYEQGKKDINQAAALTVLKLANALTAHGGGRQYTIEDLLEVKGLSE